MQSLESGRDPVRAATLTRVLNLISEMPLSRRHGLSLVAHRGVHDNVQVPENSRGALEAAVRGGVAAEIDLFFFDSGDVRVLHGPLTTRKAHNLMRSAPPPEALSLEEALTIVDGQIPLMIEFKHTGAAKAEVLARAAATLRSYKGPFLAASFDVAIFSLRSQLPTVPIGFLSLLKIPKAAREADFFLLNRSIYAISRKRAPRDATVGLWTYPNISAATAELQGTSEFAIVDMSPSEVAPGEP